MNRALLIGLLSSVVLGVLGSITGGVYAYIASKNDLIMHLQNELIAKQAEIAKNNYELQKQANQLNKFNLERSNYKREIEKKYSMFSDSDEGCQVGVLDSIIRKSFNVR